MSAKFSRLLAAFRHVSSSDGPVTRPLASDELSLESDRLAAQGLFIIGPARTGTTILQNALNDSREIFLLGEPRLHQDPGTPDFTSRYNGMHRSWGNQQNKSSYCPPLHVHDVDWSTNLARLAELHRYVGSKIVINPGQASPECEQVFAFQCRHFYEARYIFTFRNPLDVVMSTRGLAELTGGDVATCTEVLRGYFTVVQLYLRFLRNLPQVRLVFHEAMTKETFDELRGFLDLPLTRAMDYYDHRKVRHYQLGDVVEADRETVTQAMSLYADFQRDAGAGFTLAQIEQNDGHLDERHFTPLGRLSWRVTRFLAQLSQSIISAD